DAAGELGEIIRLVQALEGLLPEAAIDEVVPFGDEVVDGTTTGHAAEKGAGVAEGDAAIHAAGALLAEFGFLQVEMELLPVLDAFDGRPIQRQFAEIVDEACGFSHGYNLAAAHPRHV